MPISDEEVVRTMQTNMIFADEVAKKIFSAAGDDGNDALLKAVGTLAQVIYVVADEGFREQIVDALPRLVETYLHMLDAVDEPDDRGRPN